MKLYLLAMLSLIGFCFYMDNKPVEGTVIAKYDYYSICQSQTYASKVHCMTNDYRVDNKLKPLYHNEDAERVAKDRAKHLCKTNTFTHDGWTDFITFSYRKAGENLARRFNTPQEAFKALVESPTHEANILGDFTGLGVYTEPCGGKNLSVQIFTKV